MSSRRTFLQGSIAAAVAGALPAKTLRTIGVQLYTVRTVLPEKPAETLRAIDAIGYREIEGTQGLLDKIVPALQGTSLKPVSRHLDSKVVTHASTAIRNGIHALPPGRNQAPTAHPGP